MPGVRHTRSSACKIGSTRIRHHGFTEHSGIPCATVLTVSFVLSPETGFVVSVPSATRKRCRRVGISVGKDHTTSPSASAAFVRRTASVHRVPCPTFVTIAKRPSWSGGTREQVPVICPSSQQ